MSAKSLNRVLLGSIIPGLLIMGFLFDIGVEALRVQNMGGAGYEPLLVWIIPLFELLLVLGGFGLVWLLGRPEYHSRAVAAAALVVGLLIVLAGPLLFFLAPMSMYFLMEYLTPGTYLFTAGALLVGAGIFGLLRPSVYAVNV